MAERKRVVVTGMAINTPLGDTLDGYLHALLEGRSAITHWKQLDTAQVYAKIGGDLSGYDVTAKVASLAERVPPDMHRRLRRLATRAPFSVKLALLVALDAYLDAGLSTHSWDATRVAAILAGTNFNSNYHFSNFGAFGDEPDYIDSMFAINALDTNHAGCVCELLDVKGPTYTTGAACASGNLGLRSAVDEIRHHDIDVAFVVGGAFDLSAADLHAMALIGAVSFQSFNDTPHLASRPFDTRREGFVPSHGAAVLVLESLEHAQSRGARIYAEVMGVDANSDANHLPQPSEEGQSRLTKRVLEQCGLAPEQIDFVSAHATSTPAGDVVEVRAIKNVFGAHAQHLKVNAPKSMLGHTCWAAPTVETVAAILQMNAGRLHPSINIDQLDPQVDLDVCASGPVDCDVNYFMKNSFGFGGINCISVFKKWEG